MTTKSKIILGLVGAAAAGVVVGLLLAPEKGTEIRSRISSKANGWAEHLTDLFADAKGELKNLRSRGKSMASEAGNSYNS